jgi:hypothetical protein
MGRDVFMVEMTTVRTFSFLVTIKFHASLPGICQSTIVLVAGMDYCMVIATNTVVNIMAN